MKLLSHHNKKIVLFANVVAVLGLSSLNTANATNGQLMSCVGTYKCGMGGAGIAIPSDASAAATNPALGVKMGDEFVISAGWFHADVKGNAIGTHGNEGEQTSSASDFPNMSLAVNKRFTDDLSVNFAVYPGGGGATNWEKSRTDGAATGQGFGQDHQIDWKMLNAQLSLAFAPTPTTAIAFGLVGARSTMKTDSLDNSFQPPNPGPNSVVDVAYGVGFSIGGVWDINEMVSLGANYQSKVWHERFDKYKNTFNGPIDRPSTISVGINVKPIGGTNLSFDVKHIENSSVKAISSSSAADGGFNWKNQMVYMVGAEHQFTKDLTIRAGWNYGKGPIDDSSLFANFLFPAIVKHHFTMGASYNLSDAFEVGVSGYITPKITVTDDGNGDGFSSANATSWVSHRQYGSQLSLKYRF